MFNKKQPQKLDVPMKKNKKIKKLETLLKKVLEYKPNQPPKKPEKQPSKAELEKVYVFDGERIN